MSISNPKLENPCKKWIDFKGDKGVFSFYDKEKEQTVEIKIPIYFIVLDELATITGFCKKHDCGIYSNEVRSTTNELLRVRTFKGGEDLTGYYSEIRDSIIALGGKYTKSVYALMLNPNGSTELVNFKFRGSSFSGWLEKKFNVMNSAVGIIELKDDINGSITYKVPVFKKFAMKEEHRQRAIAADEILQDYLEKYLKGAPQKSEIPPDNQERIEEPAETNVNFEPENKDQLGQLLPKKDIRGPQPADPFGSNEQLDDLPF